MNLIYIVAAGIVVAGGLIATIKVPYTEGNERLLARYRSDQKATLRNLEAAIFECVPDSAQSPVASKFVSEVIAPLFIKIVDLRSQGMSQDGIDVQMQKWIINEHPKLLTDRPDADFAELIGVLKTMGEDEVEVCILKAATPGKAIEANAAGRNLRMVESGTQPSAIKAPALTPGEQIRVAYRANPRATLERFGMAILTCVPNDTRSPVVSNLTKTVLAPLFIDIAHGAAEDPIKWMSENHEDLMLALTEQQMAEFFGVLDKAADEAACVHRTAMSVESIESKVGEWDLRS